MMKKKKNTKSRRPPNPFKDQELAPIAHHRMWSGAIGKTFFPGGKNA